MAAIYLDSILAHFHFNLFLLSVSKAWQQWESHTKTEKAKVANECDFTVTRNY